MVDDTNPIEIEWDVINRSRPDRAADPVWSMRLSFRSTVPPSDDEIITAVASALHSATGINLVLTRHPLPDPDSNPETIGDTP